MKILLNDNELDGLSEWPYRDRALYIALRRRMDIATGTVGLVAAVSWQALREDLYVHPGQGRAVSESGTPSLRELRVSAERMEHAGAIKMISKDRQLAFRLVLADVGQARPVEVRQSSGRTSAAYDMPDQNQQQSRFGSGQVPNGDRVVAEEVRQASVFPGNSKASLSGGGDTVPADFTADVGNTIVAQQRDLDVLMETERFIAHFSATGARLPNWQARFRKWLLDSAQYAADRQKKNAAAPPLAGRPRRGRQQRCSPQDVFERMFDDQGGDGDGGDFINGSSKRVD